MHLLREWSSPKREEFVPFCVWITTHKNGANAFSRLDNSSHLQFGIGYLGIKRKQQRNRELIYFLEPRQIYLHGLYHSKMEVASLNGGEVTQSLLSEERMSISFFFFLLVQFVLSFRVTMHSICILLGLTANKNIHPNTYVISLLPRNLQKGLWTFPFCYMELL